MAGFFMVITIKREALFWSGFFIGIFWFYWIGLSFRFLDSTYVIPFVIFFVSFIYGFLFWFLGLFKNIFARGTILLFMDIFTPFGFNWFKPELTLINSYIGVQKWQFALFLVSICFFIISHKNLLFAGNEFQQKFLSLKLCLSARETIMIFIFVCVFLKYDCFILYSISLKANFFIDCLFYNQRLLFLFGM